MAEIDVLLSASLKRIAQPGDAAGVADAIRSRVDAGDTGTPASSSGFGGGGGPLTWLPWVGVVVVGGIIGGAVGASGVLAAPPMVPALSSGVLGDSVTATGCPGGAGVVELDRGTRVLAVVRSEDSAYLGVRDPLDVGRTVWLPVGVVVVDEGQPAIATLPVDGCPVPTLLTETPPPAPVPPAPAPEQSVPEQPAPPPPPSDTTPPGISAGAFSPQPVYGTEAAPYCPVVATITVTASDNVGIASVSGSSNAGGTVSLTGSSGSNFTFSYSVSHPTGANKNVTITFVATDTSGNQSSTQSGLAITSAGNCLI